MPLSAKAELQNVTVGSTILQRSTVPSHTDDTAEGKRILDNFLFNICGAAGDWTTESFIEESIAGIRERTGCEDIEDAFVKAIYMVEPE